MRFDGFVRPDGRVGTRNHVVVVPTVICAAAVARDVAAAAPGAVALEQHYGCDFERDLTTRVARVLANTADHPNVYAALFLSLGCEIIQPAMRAEVASLQSAGVRCEWLTIQGQGGRRRAVDAGSDIVRQWVAEAAAAPRQSVDASHLVLGVECGGSDAFSGLSANPALGVAADLLVALGGTVILSETSEMFGAERDLLSRARDDAVRQRIVDFISREEEFVASLGLGDAAGSVTLAPGNEDGGLTTIEEKSLGCVRKGGRSTIQDFVEYGARVRGPGLFLMDTPGHDVRSMTGMAAGGANLMGFTTGRGTPTGHATVPVLKIGSNPQVFMDMPDVIDVNAGSIVEGTCSVEAVGREILRHLLRVASGELTNAERNGHAEFSIAPPHHPRSANPTIGCQEACP